VKLVHVPRDFPGLGFQATGDVSQGAQLQRDLFGRLRLLQHGIARDRQTVDGIRFSFGEVGDAIVLVANAIADGYRLLEWQSVEERLQIGSILTGFIQSNLRRCLLNASVAVLDAWDRISEG
jgi:hypothetical protein